MDEIQQQIELIWLDIKMAQDRQKAYADSKQSNGFFNVGDLVSLQIKKMRSSLSLGKYKKLSTQCYRQYKMTKRVKNQVYELFLPPHIKIHNVFYINMLKKYVLDLDNELPLTTD